MDHVKMFHGRTHKVICKACGFKGAHFCAPGEKLSSAACPLCHRRELRVKHFNAREFLTPPHAGGLPNGDKESE